MRFNLQPPTSSFEAGGRPAPARAAGLALSLACAVLGIAVAAVAAETQPALRRMVDPAGSFVPVKAKLFKDLESFEITDYDRVRARNTGNLYALVHMKKGVPALEPLEFRLLGLQLDFAARDSEGVTYRFHGKFTRGGYLDRMEKSSQVILQGELSSYHDQELLRRESLDFRYRRIE